ncbi:MAG: general secretion pathway protein GspB [Wenzhouxiangella sp.]
MSYILDALRKSESQRRLGQPPDLASGPAPAAPVSRRGGKPLLKWALGALMLGAGLAGLAYWFGLAGLGAPDESATLVEMPVPGDPAEADASAEPASADQVREEVDGSSDRDAQQAGAERRRRAVVDRRSPVQRSVTAVSRPAPARPGAVTTPPPVVPDGERERLVRDPEQAQRLIEAQSSGSADSTADELEPDTRQDRPDAPASGGPGSAEWTPERAEYLQVWELPLSVRRELPELQLSIHVYSADADDRFVLINGERRTEGSVLADGARLADINRHGAVVEFRDYRFLLTP